MPWFYFECARFQYSHVLLVDFHRFSPTYAVTVSAAALQKQKATYASDHLQKLFRYRKLVFFQPVDVTAVEAGAWTTRHDELSHTVRPVTRKRKPDAGRKLHPCKPSRRKPLLQHHTLSRSQRGCIRRSATAIAAVQRFASKAVALNAAHTIAIPEFLQTARHSCA